MASTTPTSNASQRLWSLGVHAGRLTHATATTLATGLLVVPPPTSATATSAAQAQRRRVTSRPSKNGAATKSTATPANAQAAGAGAGAAAAALDDGVVKADRQSRAEADRVLDSSMVSSMFALPDSDDSDDDGDAGDGAGAPSYGVGSGTGVGAAGARDLGAALRGIRDGSLRLTPAAVDAWRRRAARYGLSVDGATAASTHGICEYDSSAAASERTRSQLGARGFFTSPPVDASGSTSSSASPSPGAPPLQRMAAFVRQLKADGWPPIFGFLTAEFWSMIDAVFPVVAPVLGDDCVLEPSVFIWSLDKPAPASTPLSHAPLRKEKAGANFGLPHRDYPHNECFDDAGNPTLLNVWVPLCDATLDNGCMYVVPKEHDALFASPEDDGHLKAALPVAGSDGRQFTVRFDLGAARALPGCAGEVMSWHGNLIHWGGRCSSSASEPRASFACAFRAARTERTHLDIESGMPCLTREEVQALDVHARLRLVARGVELFRWWFPFDSDDAVPPEFYESLETEAATS